jgi:hypothetical protein
MRSPAPRVLLVAVIAVALVAGVGAPVAGDAVSTAPSLSPAPVSAPVDHSVAADAPAGHDSAGDDPIEQIDGEFDPETATAIRIELSPDRDARWEVSIRYALADESERAAFETAGDRFLDGEIGPNGELFEGFAREASRNVDRTMRIENVERDVTVHEDPSSFDVAGDETDAVGELRLTFVWTEFLAQDGENLVLGDALTTPNDGTWLGSLEEGQTLEIATPDGYTVTGTPGATVPLRNNAVIIEGPRAFGPDERVAVIYAPTGAVGPPWTILAVAIVLAALLIAGSIIGYRRMDGGPIAVGGDTDENGANGTTGDASGRSSDTGTGADISADGATSGETKPEEDLSLLSDEERVERLLTESGGRMRQADIVAETGWSDAKVSQLLSAMAEAGRVEKLRLGRENLISLPDTEDGRDDGRDGDNRDGGRTNDRSPS